MELYKAVISGNVDIKEGIIFVKAGLFYSEEVKNKYPYMFEDIEGELIVEEAVETVEPIEFPAEIIEVTEEIVEPIKIVEEVVVPVEEAIAPEAETKSKK